MVDYKIRDKKTGKYRLASNGTDSINTSLGLVNGRPLNFSAVDIEALKGVEETLDEESKKAD